MSAGTFSSQDGTGLGYSVTMIGMSSFSPFVLAESVPTAVLLQSVAADNQTTVLPIIHIATLLLLLMGGAVLARLCGDSIEA